MTQLFEDLTASRGELARRGLHKGHFFEAARPEKRKDCAVCAVGAMYAGLGQTSMRDAMPVNLLARYRAEKRAIAAVITNNDAVKYAGNEFGWITSYSDRPDVTRDDVLAVFDKAIEAAS